MGGYIPLSAHAVAIWDRATDMIRAGGAVATTVGVLGVAIVVAMLIWLKVLNNQKKRFQRVPPERLADLCDYYLTRYGIKGNRLPEIEKCKLIHKELNQRFMLAVIFAILGACTFTIALWITTQAVRIPPGQPATTQSLPPPPPPPPDLRSTAIHWIQRGVKELGAVSEDRDTRLAMYVYLIRAATITPGAETELESIWNRSLPLQWNLLSLSSHALGRSRSEMAALRRHPVALRVLREYVAAHPPKDGSAGEQLSRALFDCFGLSGDIPNAEVYMNEYLKAQPQNDPSGNSDRTREDAYRRLAGYCLRDGRRDESTAALKKSQEFRDSADVKDVMFSYPPGRLSKGDEEERAKRLAAIKEPDSEFHYAVAEWFSELGLHDDAWKHASKVEPESTFGRQRYTGVIMRAAMDGLPEKADAWLANIRLADSESDSSHSAIAEAYAVKGQLAKAEEHLSKVHSAMSQVAPLLSIAVSQHASGNNARSSAAFSQAEALILKESNSRWRNALLGDLAEAYAQAGRLNDSERCLAADFTEAEKRVLRRRISFARGTALGRSGAVSAADNWVTALQTAEERLAGCAGVALGISTRPLGTAIPATSPAP